MKEEKWRGRKLPLQVLRYILVVGIPSLTFLSLPQDSLPVPSHFISFSSLSHPFPDPLFAPLDLPTPSSPFPIIIMYIFPPKFPPLPNYSLKYSSLNFLPLHFSPLSPKNKLCSVFLSLPLSLILVDQLIQLCFSFLPSSIVFVVSVPVTLVAILVVVILVVSFRGCVFGGVGLVSLVLRVLVLVSLSLWFFFLLPSWVSLILIPFLIVSFPALFFHYPVHFSSQTILYTLILLSYSSA